jgi:hypothetical protein
MTTATAPRKGGSRPARRPLVFDLVAHYEPSAHFQFTRRVRNDFDELAREYTRSTWLLGRYGGRPVMQTDIEGIGVACRVEIGRLVLRDRSQYGLLRSAMQMFREAQDRELASGPVSRLIVHFSKADDRPHERESVRAAFVDAFAGVEGEEGEPLDCAFLSDEIDRLELGRCVEYQRLTNYLREDGHYHSAHRARIDKVQRHLQQEVGRYENHRFFLRTHAPEPGQVPQIDFCYTGDKADVRVEAFLEGYTGEKVQFVPRENFHAQSGRFVGLSDYERASRRFGSLWILQEDLVRRLYPQQVGVLYLFFDDSGQPELDRSFTWDELFERQRSSPFIARASRNSQTYLDMVLEGLVRNRFVDDEGDAFRLAGGFAGFRHVTFFSLGEFRKRQI